MVFDIYEFGEPKGLSHVELLRVEPLWKLCSSACLHEDNTTMNYLGGPQVPISIGEH